MVAFPIKASSDGLSLTDSNGTPFLYLADTCWLAISKMTQEQLSAYFDARKAQGFNTIQISLLPFIGTHPKETNAYDKLPFNNRNLASPLLIGTPTADSTSVDYDYWDHVEYAIDLANSKNLLLNLVPCWYGFGGADWRGYVTETNVVPYAEFLASRFGNKPNIMWLHGGDNNPDTDTARVPAGLSTANKITATNTFANTLRSRSLVSHLASYHAKRPVSSYDYFNGQPWHTYASAYSREQTYQYVSSSYGRGLPTVMTEAYYDNRSVNPVLNRQRLRAQAWWSYLSGAAGFAYGHENVWGTEGWEAFLNAPSALDAIEVKRFIESRAGSKLKPVPSLLTQGYGSSVVGSLDKATTLLSDNKKIAIGYFPNSRSVTIDLTQFVGGAVNPGQPVRNDGSWVLTDIWNPNESWTETVTQNPGDGGGTSGELWTLTDPWVLTESWTNPSSGGGTGTTEGTAWNIANIWNGTEAWSV